MNEINLRVQNVWVVGRSLGDSVPLCAKTDGSPEAFLLPNEVSDAETWCRRVGDYIQQRSGFEGPTLMGPTEPLGAIRRQPQKNLSNTRNINIRSTVDCSMDSATYFGDNIIGRRRISSRQCGPRSPCTSLARRRSVAELRVERNCDISPLIPEMREVKRARCPRSWEWDARDFGTQRTESLIQRSRVRLSSHWNVSYVMITLRLMRGFPPIDPIRTERGSVQSVRVNHLDGYSLAMRERRARVGSYGSWW